MVKMLGENFSLPAFPLELGRQTFVGPERKFSPGFPLPPIFLHSQIKQQKIHIFSPIFFIPPKFHPTKHSVKERNKWLANLYSPITEKEKWGECLAFGLPKGHGGTVIFTSRDEKLAKMMVGEKNLLHLRPLLDPKSCASIFNEHIKDEQKLENDLEKKEFLKKCAGLPFAVTMMGKIKSELVKAAEKAAKEAAEKSEKEPAKKMEPESPISSKDEEKNKTEELPTEPKPIQPDAAAKSSKDDKKIKSEEVPAGEKHIQQQEKDARSSIGSKDDEQIISEEHPAESEPRPQQEGAAHNEIHKEAASGTN